MQKEQENYITTAELAKMLGISRVAAAKRVTKLIKEGAVTATERGKGYIINKDSLPDEIKDEIRKQQEEAAKKITELGRKAGHDLEFEKELWKAADKLRGSIDASEYKHIVLGLLFLKYVSDSYYQRRWQLEKWTSNPKNKDYFIKNEAERKHVIGDKDQYKSTGVFYIPEKSRWEQLRNHAMHHDIGKYIDEAMEAIENENPKELKGVLPKIYTKTTLDYQILGELVNIFSKITFDHDIDKEKDILGRVYEYFLGQFASAEGKRGGEFYTPRSIVRLLVEVLSPYENARVFDPACGSGGMFVQSSEFLKMHQKDPTKISFFGQESNPTTLRLCKMNLAIRGIIGQMEIGNSYYDDKFPDLRADFVLANPPFNADWEPGRLSDKDPRVKFGTPPGSNANFLWIQHFIHHLSPNGMAGFVMHTNAASVLGREGEIRKKIIDNDLVDVIVDCPAKLFYNVSLPVSLWFISKNKSNGRFRNRVGEILFIDAHDLYKAISRKQVIFTQEHIDTVANTIRSWRGESNTGEYKDVQGFCKSLNIEAVKKGGYVLSPSRYVGRVSEVIDTLSFQERIKQVKQKINREAREEGELNKKIERKLDEVGLKDFNGKIEFLRKENRALEDLIEALFKHWFIDFEFQDQSGKPYKSAGGKMISSDLGEIPEGWQIKNITEIIERISVGKKYDNKTASPIGKVPILDQGQSGFIGYHNEKPGVIANIQNPVIIFTNHTCNYRLVTFPFSAIQNVLPYIGKNGYPTLFIYYLTKDKIKMREYKGHWPEFERQIFIVPPVEVARRFSDIIEPMVEKLTLNERSKT